MGLNRGEQGQFEQAFRYQDLAHDLCARYPNTFGATRGMNGIVWCNMHSRSHPSEIVDYSLKAIQCGKNCGDLYNAGLSYGPLMWNLVVQGKGLLQVEEYAEECLAFSKKNQLSFSIGLAQAVLAGWVAPMKPDYQPIDMRQTLACWADDNYVAASASYFALLGFSQYYLGDYAAAARSLEAVERYLHGLTDNVLKRLWFVFRVLNRLRLTPLAPATHDGADTPPTWPELQAEIAPLMEKIETWAKLGPLLRPYLAFVHAEIARVSGAPREARNRYLDAIAEAQTQNYGLLSGHLYECLGDLLHGGRLGDADIYHAQALRLYRACGADGKSALLQGRQGQVAVDPPSTGTERVAEPVTDGADQATLPNLDINYLMKSALALSAEIDLAQLLQKIMTVVLESSGAQHGYLLIREQGVLVVAAENHVGQGNRQAISDQHYSLAKARGICQAVVNYVFRTREKVVLRDACVEGAFQDAPEVQVLGLRSVLCLPVVKQAQLIGVLYLENRLSEGVFTPEKSGMTELLTSHAAISLENVRLLEETRSAFTQLETNQRHMVQMEKLTAMGTLVGGVAHEINNPLMGVLNFVEYAADKATDSKSREVLGQALHEIHRIKMIVRNMLMFVGTNTDPSGRCDISAVVNQTLLLLAGELKNSSIELGTDLPQNLPQVVCAADSLQQVLVNLLLNARDALREHAQPRIAICARQHGAQVVLTVADNGPGIPEALLSRVFDPFFTTKPPGQGTGLGLSVSLGLIEETGGSIKARQNEGHGCCMQIELNAQMLPKGPQ
jgi:signal transduction histidine kinase